MRGMITAPFSLDLQVDKIAAPSQGSQKLVFTFYMHSDTIKEFLFCELLWVIAKAGDISERIKFLCQAKNMQTEREVTSLT